jgi:methyl-accepting chemotaxis protein
MNYILFIQNLLQENTSVNYKEEISFCSKLRYNQNLHAHDLYKRFKVKKLVATILSGLFIISGIGAQEAITPDEWQVREVSASENSFRETGSLDGFASYTGGAIPHDAAITDRKVVFVYQTALKVPADGSRIALLVGPSDYPCDFYLNGHLLGHIGNHGTYYNSTVYYASRYAIDPAILTGTDTLVIEAFPTYEVTALPIVKIGGWDGIARELFWRNLMNVNLIQASVVFALVLGAFFILLYLMGSHDKKYLWFILVCFTFALSYTNMSMYNDGQDVMVFDKMTRCGMPLSTFLLFMFAREFSGFRVKNRKIGNALDVVLFVPVLASCIATIAGSGKEAVFTTFSKYTTGMLMPLFLLLTLAFLVYGLVKRPGADTIGVLVGFSSLIAASVHDITLSIAGKIPFFWIVPYGYLGFVLSIFFVLALDQTAVLKKTRKQALVMETQHEALSNVVKNLTQVSEGLVSSSKILSDTMNDTLAVVENYGMENRAILDEVSKQAKTVEQQIEKITDRLTTQASRIPEAIANQTKAAKGVTDALQELGERISGSLGAVEQSNGFISGLAGDADGSRKVVHNSWEALSRVEKTSEQVKAVLGMIGDLSEQINVLSINAAIESARYGNAGKGFAVIAQEIRKFSNQSQENLKQSFDGVQEMSEAIAETIKNHDAVRAALEEIISKSHRAAEQSASITRLVHEQEEESRSMASGADRMIRETNTLESLSQEERTMNENLKQTLSDIAGNFELLSRRLENQGTMKETLFISIDQMRSIMQVNEDNINKLKVSIQNAQDANQTA